MGVKYLQSFVRAKADILLTHRRLHNCTLVIDGNNLAYALYASGGSGGQGVSYEYAGDYDTYAEVVRECFRAFSLCHIEVLVLMDGASKDIKENTHIRRAKQRIRKLCTGVITEDLSGIPPIFLLSVFNQVLREMEITVITCDYEADEHVVSVANQVGGIVLSDDSDFLIFECQKGVIMIDGFNWNVQQEGDTHYLDVRVYHIDNLKEAYELQSCHHARILSILMGNDYIEREETVEFVNSLSNATSLSPCERTELILNWLSQVISLKVAMAEIVQVVVERDPEAAEETLYERIKKASKTYRIPNSVTVTHLNNRMVLELDSQLKSPRERRAPGYLYELFQAGHFAPAFMNVFCRRKNILSCQVEAVGQNSSHECAVELRCILYTLITSIDWQSDKALNIPVKERDRMQGILIIKSRDSVVRLPNRDLVICIHDVHSESRYQMLMDALNYPISTNGDAWSCFITLVVGVLRYWKRHSSTQVKTKHEAAVVMCLIKLLLVDTDGRDVCQYGESFPVVDEEHLQVVKTELGSISNDPEGTYCPLTVHRFAELQAVMFAVYGLNGVLNMPVIIPQMNYIYNGSFIYRLITRFETNCEQEQDVHEHARQLLTQQRLVDVYNSIVTRL